MSITGSGNFENCSIKFEENSKNIEVAQLSSFFKIVQIVLKVENFWSSYSTVWNLKTFWKNCEKHPIFSGRGNFENEKFESILQSQTQRNFEKCRNHPIFKLFQNSWDYFLNGKIFEVGIPQFEI